MKSITEYSADCNNQPQNSNRANLITWYYDAFIPAPARGYALMNPPGKAEKYTRRNEPLTLDLLFGALNGETRRLPIGGGDCRQWVSIARSFAITPQTTDKKPLARNIALDVDTGGTPALAKVLDVCKAHGLGAFAQESESPTHSGGHIHILGTELLPAPMLNDIGQRIAQAAGVEAEIYPKAADIRLPLMTHLRAPGGPRRFPLILQTGEIIDASDPWNALERLCLHCEFNTPESFTKALDTLPALPEPEKRVQPRHKSKVNGGNPTSVITWRNENYSLKDALEDAGAIFKHDNARLICCPFHDDHHPSLGIFRTADDKTVCHCFTPGCKAHNAAYLDAFDVHCLRHNLSASQAVKQLVEQYELGKKRETVVIENQKTTEPADVTPGALAIHQQLIVKSRDQLAHKLMMATARRGELTVIRATMGLGKTHAAAELANRSQVEGKQVAVFAPTLEVAQSEWLPRLKNGFVWRSKIDTCTCQDKKYLEWCLRFGYKIPTCISPDCPYARQAQQAFGKVIIYQHAHLALADFPQFDVLIVDESPLAALLPEKYLTNGTLAGFVKRYPDDPAVPLVQAFHEAALELPQTMQDIRGQALIVAIEKHLPNMTLTEAISRAHRSDHDTHSPQPPPTEVGMMHQFLAGLLDMLGASPEALSFGRSPGANKHCYVWHARATLSEKTRSALLPPAILVLDGSADETISRKLYEPWPVQFVDISCPVSPLVEITQVTCTQSTRHVVKEDRLLHNLADSVAQACVRVGVKLDGGITYMAAVDTMQQMFGGAWLHYGGQRGSNELSGASAVAIVASPTTPPAALERKSLALWSDIGCVWHKGESTGLYNAEDGRLQAMNQLHAMEELRQSIYRARPLTADKPMHLLIFTPWALDAIELQPNRTITNLAHGSSTEAKAAVEKYQASAGSGWADTQPPAIKSSFSIVYKYYEDISTIENDQNVAEDNPPPLSAKGEISRPATVEPVPEPIQAPSPVVSGVSPAVVWRRFLGDPSAWLHELELAAKSSDPMKRRAGAKLHGYLSGIPIDKRDFVIQTHELNASLLFKMDWQAIQVGT